MYYITTILFVCYTFVILGGWYRDIVHFDHFKSTLDVANPFIKKRALLFRCSWKINSIRQMFCANIFIYSIYRIAALIVFPFPLLKFVWWSPIQILLSHLCCHAFKSSFASHQTSAKNSVHFHTSFSVPFLICLFQNQWTENPFLLWMCFSLLYCFFLVPLENKSEAVNCRPRIILNHKAR